MTEFLINLSSTVILVVMGGYILFAGRRATWATSGVVGLTVTARLLAVLVAGFDTGRELIEFREWELVGIAVLVGILGAVLGRARPDLAVLLVGFAAGADVALWLYDIVAYVLVAVAQLLQTVVFWVGLAVIIGGGLLGLRLIRVSRDEGLILITMLIGVQFIRDVLGLSGTSSWTAIAILGLGLAGLLVQYAFYLREERALSELTEPEPHASSVAYFQDLQLDD